MFLGIKGLGLRVFCIDVFAAFSESCSKKAAKFRHYSMSIGFLFFLSMEVLCNTCAQSKYMQLACTSSGCWFSDALANFSCSRNVWTLARAKCVLARKLKNGYLGLCRYIFTTKNSAYGFRSAVGQREVVI